MTKIEMSGNIITVTPPHEALLADKLSYYHRKTTMGFGRRPAVEVEYVSLYSIKGTSLVAMAGLLPRIQSVLDEAKVEYSVTNHNTKLLTPDFESLTRSMAGVSFRFRQDDIIAHLMVLSRGVIVAPTGFGKTFLELVLCGLYPKANIVIAVPGRALVKDTHGRLAAVFPDVGLVMGGVYSPARVTVTTYDSILKTPVHKCDILLVDECHKAAAPQMAAALAKISEPTKVFGFTASPEGRSDGAELVTESLIGPVVYRVKYDAAAEAGIVSNIKVVALSLPDTACPMFSHKVRTTVAKKRWCYWLNSRRNRLFALAIPKLAEKYELGEDPQVLVLVDTLAHAVALKKHLPDYELMYSSGSSAQIADYSEDLPEGTVALTEAKRAEMLANFSDGTLRKVIATGCWGTGVDFKFLDILVYASGAPGSITATQWPGRNSRKYEGKKFGLVVDCDDKFDPWAVQRASSRFRCYKKNGWEVIETKL